MLGRVDALGGGRGDAGQDQQRVHTRGVRPGDVGFGVVAGVQALLGRLADALSRFTQQRDRRLADHDVGRPTDGPLERRGEHATAGHQVTVGADVGTVDVDSHEARAAQERPHGQGQPVVGDPTVIADHHVVGIGAVGDRQPAALDLGAQARIAEHVDARVWRLVRNQPRRGHEG